MSKDKYPTPEVVGNSVMIPLVTFQAMKADIASAEIEALKTAGTAEKPKQVRVYIKEDAKQIINNYPDGPGFADSMQSMTGGVFDLNHVDEERDRAYVDKSDGDIWAFTMEACVIVEGELPHD